MGFGQQAYIDPVLLEEMIQFMLPARTPSALQQANSMALVHFVRLGRAAIFGYKEDDDFEHSP